MLVRFLLISLLCLPISGCFLYGDLHSYVKPYDPAELSVKHVYPIPKATSNTVWFTKFNDPQLNQLIEVALHDSPDMATAQARIQQARSLAKGAYAALWPNVDFSGYIQRQQFPTYGLAPPPYNGLAFNIAELGFNLNYQIDFWGKNRAIFASALSQAFAQDAELADTQLTLSSAVATAYFQLLGSIDQLHLAKDNLKLLQEQANIVLGRAKQGIESDIPVKTAIANAQSAALNVEEYKRIELISRHQLAVLLGKNPFNTEIITPNSTYQNKGFPVPDIIPANLLGQRPDIIAARELTQAAAHQIKAARANFYPNVNLSGLLSLQTVLLKELFNPLSQNNAITGAVDLPIFDAGARRANLGAKYAQYDLAVSNYNQTILTALRQVADQLSTLKALDAQIASQTQAVSSTQTNYDLFRSRYNQGIIDYLQFIEIKQLLVQQKITLRNLQTRHLQAIVALLEALGGELQT